MDNMSPYQVSESGLGSPNHVNHQALPTSIPKVFGIINIVYAVIGIVFSLLALVFSLAAGAFFSKVSEDLGDAEAEQISQMSSAFDQMRWAVFLDGGIKIALGIALLMAGIGLLKRRLWGLKLTQFWALARIIAAIAIIFITASATAEFQEQLAQSDPQNTQLEMQQKMQVFSNVFNVILYSAYPIVCIIFMSKKRVRDALS